MNHILILTLLIFGISPSALLGDSYSIAELVKIALEKNPSLKAIDLSAKASLKASSAKTALADPMIGFSELNRGSKTQYWTIKQKIEMPQKYFLRRDIHEAKAKAMTEQLSQRKLNIRAEVINI